MNTDSSVCAPSAQGWTLINWSQVQLRVKKLQARIVKATEASKLGKGKSLAVVADPLVLRKSISSETSDRKPGEKHSRS